MANNKIILTAGLIGSATFLFQYLPPPDWLMADYEKAYLPAGRAALSDHAALTGLLAKGVAGFVNLPIVSFLFAPFALMPFYVGELVFLAIGGLAGLWLWRESVILFDLNTRVSAILLFLLIGSGPAAYNLVNGNTSQIVILLITLGLGAFMQRRDFSAGALFALAALIKPALIILGVFTLLRGRWKVTLSGGVVCVSATLFSILIFGWSMHMHWLEETILPALDGTILAHNVQSIGSVIGRAFIGTEYLSDWNAHTVPDLASVISLTLRLLTLSVIVGCLILLARRSTPVVTAPLEISFILMIPLLIPNLVWSHYLIWAFLPAALCLRDVSLDGPLNKRQVWALVALALVAQPVQMLNFASPMVQEIFGRVVVSLPLIGVLILLVLMVQMTLALRHGDSEAGLVLANDRRTAFSPAIPIPSLKALGS